MESIDIGEPIVFYEKEDPISKIFLDLAQTNYRPMTEQLFNLNHLAIIMDGNGRWATKSKPRSYSRA